MVMMDDSGDHGLICLTKCWGFKQTELREAVKKSGMGIWGCVTPSYTCKHGQDQKH